MSLYTALKNQIAQQPFRRMSQSAIETAAQVIEENIAPIQQEGALQAVATQYATLGHTFGLEVATAYARNLKRNLDNYGVAGLSRVITTLDQQVLKYQGEGGKEFLSNVISETGKDKGLTQIFATHEATWEKNFEENLLKQDYDTQSVKATTQVLKEKGKFSRYATQLSLATHVDKIQKHSKEVAHTFLEYAPLLLKEFTHTQRGLIVEGLLNYNNKENARKYLNHAVDQKTKQMLVAGSKKIISERKLGLYTVLGIVVGILYTGFNSCNSTQQQTKPPIQRKQDNIREVPVFPKRVESDLEIRLKRKELGLKKRTALV